MAASNPSKTVLFGAFELDREAGELRKHGVRVKLQEQPFRVLVILIDRAGQVVTKEELRQQLWSSHTFVDFDHGLHSAITRLREALGDSSESPRFVETLPRRGYRFVGSVKVIANEAPSEGALEHRMWSLGGRFGRFGATILAGLLSGALLLGVLLSLDGGGFRRWLLRESNPPFRSLAVLPLQNLSGNPAEDYFVDGMTDELTTELSKIRSLRVTSRTSVMRYKEKRKPPPEIARELNVDGVIEGSVLRSGDRVRITAQLLNASTDRHLWAESYDRDLRDVLALQSEVARDIATQVRITLTPQEQARLGNQRRVDPEVFQLYLKGRYYSNQGGGAGGVSGEEAVRRGIGFFDEAIAKDSSYSPAYAGEAFAYTGLANSFAPPQEVMPKAKAAAQKAIQLDDTLSEAHTALAFVLLFFDWDWSRAETELKRAIELNPNSAEAHDLYGDYFTALEEYPAAIVESRRAHELDPLSLRIYGDLLFNLLSSRQYDRTIAETRRALALDSQFATAYAVNGLAHAEQKRFPEALAALKKAAQLDPNPTIQLFLAHVEAVTGNKAEARALLARIEDLSRTHYVCAYEISSVHVSLGDNDKAFQWLEKGRQERCDCMVWLISEPWMDPLRVDPRYLSLLKQVGFTSAK